MDRGLADKMPVTTTMMMRVSLVPIGRNLIAVTVAMAHTRGDIIINASNRLHRVRNRAARQ